MDTGEVLVDAAMVHDACRQGVLNVVSHYVSRERACLCVFVKKLLRFTSHGLRGVDVGESLTM